MTAAVSVAEAIDTLNNKTLLEVATKTTEASSGIQNEKEMTNNASRSSICSQNATEEASTIVVNPLLNEFVDCIENLPSRLQLLLSELRNIDAQVNIRHRKIQIVKQQILAKTIQAATTSLSAAKSDGTDSTNSSSSSETGGDTTNSKVSTIIESKLTIEQLLNTLHQILLQCQLLGDQKVKVTGQIMDILSTKTRKLGLDAKSNEERNFQVELDEEKIVNEFKIAIKKRSMHAKKNQLSNSAANNNNSSSQNNNRVSSRHVHTAHSLQTGSSKSKQQHLNSAEINKAVAKYTKSSNAVNNNHNSSTSNNNFKFLSNNRNPIDAYSFDEDQLSSMDTLNNRLKTSNKNHDSESDTKSLRSLNNLMNGTGNKKANLRNKYSEMKMSNGAKKSVKKLRDASMQLSKNSKNDNSPQSLNSRPKRHLNYNNNSESKNNMSTNKKRRLGQIKSNRLSLSLTNENSLTQCNSPSSSSTSSMNIGKLKSSRSMLNKSATGSSKLMKSGDKLSASGKDTRLKRKSDQLEERSGNMKNRMIKKNRKAAAGKLPYMQRRTNRSIENQDDADDDLSDENDEYSATAFDSDNDNDEDDTDIENREFNQKAHRGSENEDMNSNETESINELDDMNNSDNEGMDEDEENEDEDGEGNDSNLSENDNEDDIEETDYRNNTGRKSKGFKNYESYNEENSENDLANTNTGKTKANKRIKSLLYQQQKVKSKTGNQSNAANNNNHGMEFPIESEPIYCICSEISYGQMICCDNDSCKIEWFHFECVKLNSKPKGKWYCPHCRGDSHKVMRKFANSETTSNYNYSSSYRIK